MPPLPDLSIVDAPLPYVPHLETRPLEQVDLVVIHCTELPDLAAAREYGERKLYPSGTGNSGHYYIDRDGSVRRYVPDDHIAHHVRGHNARAIGIELVNAGRYPHWLDSRRQAMDEAYPDVQIDALVALLHRLAAELPSLRHIAGHQDLDRGTVAASDDPSLQVRRKLDPGPRFPWPRVLAEVPLHRLTG
ncbi:N-acetylmuramoyl-L-alanine amidase [Pseudoxanthomonas broegbernensis]|uniref:N-acetylmuramoyl-L-alanine amidase n=1 Tax=Pseudoxanthomonas broegbernensis TaxID=83619 RepID=A0A7V8K786_9GAMM|nr:N-acetylmuramoyl-L-alanine amidase [Pseudoxanthomonas broegbernensis]KAF1686284.1 N-acetylmuramoyl-L-alanine amidase [Pseudoxanthomonas broegbernensis]MBB6063968.1 N-acetylmuramoyl-L-alanine amidase [Pseudoxanthomonas broegbernensis]